MVLYSFSSPLKSIQGAAIQDRTSVVASPHPVRAVGRPPLPPRSEWVLAPKGSLCPKRNEAVLRSISVASKPVYRPQGQLTSHTIQVQKAQQVCVVNYNDKDRKVIISRQLLINGHVTFVIGTKSGDIVTRDPEEVPLSQILNHVTPAELQRYENYQYNLEDIHEANLPPPKPRGRPRKILVAQRPPGQARNVAVVVPITSPQAQRVITPSSAVSKLQRISIPVPSRPVASHGHPVNGPTLNGPSFNGPQPGYARDFSGSEALSSADELHLPKQAKRPQYSMVAASKLPASETSQDGETSRSESFNPLAVDERPSSKRRKLASDLPDLTSSQLIRNQLDQQLDGSGNSRSGSRTPSSDQGDTDPVSVVEMRDEEGEREALLRQFQTSNKPVAKPSPVSIGNLTKHTLDQAKITSTTTGATVRPPIEVTTPSKKKSAPLSLTPHFPRGARFSNNPSKDPLPKFRQMAVPSPSRNSSSISHPSALPKELIHKAKSRIPPPPSAFPVRNKTAQPINASNTTGQNHRRPAQPQNPSPTSDSTKYIRPKPENPASSSRKPSSDSGSEDPLARASSSPSSSSSSSSSTDSLRSKTIHLSHRPPPHPQSLSQPHSTPTESDDTSSIHSKLPSTSYPPSATRATTTNQRSSEIPDSEDEDRRTGMDRVTGYIRATLRPAQVGQRSVEVVNLEAEGSESSEGDSDDVVV